MANSFGKIFKFTTWGESHGQSIGCVIDGVPPGIKLSLKDFIKELSRRKPGKNNLVSERKEEDNIEILSGVFQDYTTGTPISLLIKNNDKRSSDYDDIKDKFRPGHADYTYQVKYGIRDYRGGGRASARETALRVAAGVLARKILGEKIKIKSAMIQLGGDKINNNAEWNWLETKNNIFSCPIKSKVREWTTLLEKVKAEGNSVGCIIEMHISGIQPGIGEPLYDKLDADLASAVMGINAIKGVEIGAGFSIVDMYGDVANDEMQIDDKGKVDFLSNNAGGILGGISTGQDIILRYVVKPTSSIARSLRSIDLERKNIKINTKGRHDPCVGIRAIPVVEAMVACVLADHYLLSKLWGK